MNKVVLILKNLKWIYQELIVFGYKYDDSIKKEYILK